MSAAEKRYLDRRAITSCLIENRVSIAGLAEQMGLEQAQTRALIYSAEPVTDKVIEQLARVLGVDEELISGSRVLVSLRQADDRERLRKLEDEVVRLNLENRDMRTILQMLVEAGTVTS